MTIEEKIASVKLEFYTVRELYYYASQYSVINHRNYSRNWNIVLNNCIKRLEWLQARIHDLECGCGISHIQRLLNKYNDRVEH